MAENEQLNNDLTERLAFLNAALARKYRRCDGSGDRFLTADSRVFFLTGLWDDPAIVVEYAVSLAEASLTALKTATSSSWTCCRLRKCSPPSSRRSKMSALYIDEYSTT